jgi:hypothetical protein
LQPACEFGVQVFGLVDAQDVNDARVFLLGFLDAAMLQASAQDEQDIEPVSAHRHGRKHCSDLEKNSRLGRHKGDLAASLDPIGKPLVQLDNLLRLATEKLLHGELTAGVRLVAVGKLPTATGTAPEAFRLSALRLPFPHGISDSTLLLQLL